MLQEKTTDDNVIDNLGIKPILVKYGVDDVSGYSENGRNEDPNYYMSVSNRAYKLWH